MTSDTLTTTEVAAALGIHPRTVRQLAAARGVTGRRVGRAWLWPRSILRALAVRRIGRPRRKKK